MGANKSLTITNGGTDLLVQSDTLDTKCIYEIICKRVNYDLFC